MNFNRVFLGGNITRDIELTYTPKGTAVVEIGLAVNRKWKSETGEQKEEATFVDCRAWGRTAEVIAEHFSKGKPIFIEGELRQERWEDKQTGKPRSKTLVIVQSFQFVGSGGGKRPAPEEPEDLAARRKSGRSDTAPEGPTEYASPKDVAADMEEDDIPF